MQAGQRIYKPTARAPEGPNQEWYDSILELCQRQLTFSTSVFIQPASNSSLAPPGWVRKKQLYMLVAGANRHFQPWRDRAVTSTWRQPAFLFLMWCLQLLLMPSLLEGLSCWPLTNMLHPCTHFWVSGGSWHTVQWFIMKEKLYQIFLIITSFQHLSHSRGANLYMHCNKCPSGEYCQSFSHSLLSHTCAQRCTHHLNLLLTDSPVHPKRLAVVFLRCASCVDFFSKNMINTFSTF